MIKKPQKKRGLNQPSFSTAEFLNIGVYRVKNAKNITCRVKNNTYKVMVHIVLKIAKRSICGVKKMPKEHYFWVILGHTCLKLGQSEFSRKIETPSLN